MTKTNAMRLLDQAHISYEVSQYTYDENDLNGMHAAQGIGMEPEKVFKTLVAKGDRMGYLVFCIPVCRELDLKKAAKIVGEKKIELIPVKELLPVTGYIRGGCSPIGMKKKFPTYLDQSAFQYDAIAISAGIRGQQLILCPENLSSFIGMTISDLT